MRRRRRVSFESRLKSASFIQGPYREESEDDSSAKKDGEEVGDDSNIYEEPSPLTTPYAATDLPTHFLGRPINRHQPQHSNIFHALDGKVMCVDSHGHVYTTNSSRSTPDDDDNNAATTSNTTTNNNTNNNTNDDGRPPTSPWGSSRAKKRIIEELKDDTSNIHLLLGSYSLDNFKEVNFKQIHEQYAGNKYKPGLFRENVKRQLKNFISKTGPFKPEKETIEPWYTSINNVSKAYTVLYLMFMDPETSCHISNWDATQLWDSDAEFQKYDLTKFKGYVTNMKKLTDRRKALIHEESAAFEHDMITLPPLEKTSRGYPFWHKHRASELLKEDETSGAAKRMKPKQLWMSRKEYQDFPLSVFRKHIYQERMKQLAAPYWQYKRNKSAKKKYEEAQEMMREWKEHREMDAMDMDMGNLTLEDPPEMLT